MCGVGVPPRVGILAASMEARVHVSAPETRCGLRCGSEFVCPHAARRAGGAQVDKVVVAESARWGDAQRGTPFTKNDWLAATRWHTQTFFPQRTQIVLNYMRWVTSIWPGAMAARTKEQARRRAAGIGRCASPRSLS